MKIVQIIFPRELLLLYLIAGFQCCTSYSGHAQGKDSPQWGEKHTRNMVSGETGLPATFNIETGENVLTNLLTSLIHVRPIYHQKV